MKIGLITTIIGIVACAFAQPWGLAIVAIGLGSMSIAFWLTQS